MSFKNWALNIFRGRNSVTLKGCATLNLQAETAYKEFAIDLCIDLIAKAISRCEFKTYENGESKRGNNYYLLNYEPNVNKNATTFWYEAISKLLYEEETLIVMIDNHYLIADSFEIKEYALYQNQYKSIVIGDLTLDRTFYESEVIHLKLKDSSIINAINSLYDSYGKLLAATMKQYKRSKNKRWFANADMIRAQDDETQAEYDKMIQAQLEDFFDPNKEAVVFQKTRGYELENASDETNGVKADTSDFRAMIDDVINFAAMGFHIPRSMLKGDIAEVEANVDTFIMFALNPITEVVGDEYNRKVYKKDAVLNRTYMMIDTKQIKLIDLTSLSTSLDKLFAIGGYTINEVLEELGKNPIKEEWADERFVTKNYELARLALTRGGENE